MASEQNPIDWQPGRRPGIATCRRHPDRCNQPGNHRHGRTRRPARRRKRPNGTVVFFKGLAEVGANTAKKGLQIYVEGCGRASGRTRTAERYTTEIVGQEMQMLA